jgi:hypothetical protein
VSTIAITTPPADSSDTTRAGRMPHPLATDIIKATAEKHGVCVCPFTMEVGDRDTGSVLSNSGLVTFSPYKALPSASSTTNSRSPCTTFVWF